VVRLNLLGPVEVLRNGAVCTPTAKMQRSLIGLLALHANQVLPASRLIDALWEGRPPRSAGPVLQMYVTGIRRALAPQGREGGILRTTSSGYLLRLDTEQLDLTQFRTLVTSGRRQRMAGQCGRAGAMFRRALALWRGPALADLDRAGVFQPYVVRLEAERTVVLQERIGVDLCQGRSLEVIGELAELCATHPFGESFHQQLMLALHQSGRRAEALRLYARIRRAMIEEVGIEPGPGLRTTQRAILGGKDLPVFGHGNSPAPGAPRACDPAIFGR
jgi:DNA-binding SARP family transcriptional activator